MQGIFSVTFEGKKKDLEYLIRFIQEKAKSDNAYSYFEELIEYTEDFNEVGDNDSTSLVIGLEESSNISDIDTSHFEEMAHTVPSLKMMGYYSVLDEDSHTEFKSKANSTKVEFTEIDDPKICPLCEDEVDENKCFIDEEADDEDEMYFCCEKHYMLFKIINYYDENDIDYDYDELMKADKRKVKKLFNSILDEEDD